MSMGTIAMGQNADKAHRCHRNGTEVIGVIGSSHHEDFRLTTPVRTQPQQNVRGTEFTM